MLFSTQSNLVNIGATVLDRRVFDIPIEMSESGERNVTGAVTAFVGRNAIKVVEQAPRIPLVYLEDIPIAEMRVAEELMRA